MAKSDDSKYKRLKRAIKRRFRMEARLKKEAARKKEYLKHYAKAGPAHAMTYAQWQKKGKKPAYFKGIEKKSEEARLREAGIGPDRFKKRGN